MDSISCHDKTEKGITLRPGWRQGDGDEWICLGASRSEVRRRKAARKKQELAERRKRLLSY